MVPLCFPSPALGPIHKGSGRHRLQSNCHAPGHKVKEETGNADVLAAVAAQRVTHECGQGAVRTALSVLQLLRRCSSRPHDSPRATAGPWPAPQPVAQREARPCICVSNTGRYLPLKKIGVFLLFRYFFQSNFALSLVLKTMPRSLSALFLQILNDYNINFAICLTSTNYLGSVESTSKFHLAIISFLFFQRTT